LTGLIGRDWGTATAASRRAGTLGLAAEDIVLSQWKEQVRQVQREARTRLPGLVLLAESASAESAAGADWADWADPMDALEWEPGEVLVVGSSPPRVLARVFLGARATKIIRYSPVAVVVVPAAVASKIAEDLVRSCVGLRPARLGPLKRRTAGSGRSRSRPFVLS
jgi:nucleotide-binding universal stress UspA family protein